ncbi:hypothetical protein D3C81_1523360 [compost metagenome]
MSGSRRSARISISMHSATRIGTGENQNRFGRLNQRAAISACVSGVHRLITAITASSSHASLPVSLIMRCCRSPSVFMISQVLPSTVYATTSPTPQNSGKGASQSSGPPAKRWPSILMPSI